MAINGVNIYCEKFWLPFTCTCAFVCSKPSLGHSCALSVLILAYKGEILGRNQSVSKGTNIDRRCLSSGLGTEWKQETDENENENKRRGEEVQVQFHS